jgi:hypothetical protein
MASQHLREATFARTTLVRSDPSLGASPACHEGGSRQAGLASG